MARDLYRSIVVLLVLTVALRRGLPRRGLGRRRRWPSPTPPNGSLIQRDGQRRRLRPHGAGLHRPTATSSRGRPPWTTRPCRPARPRASARPAAPTSARTRRSWPTPSRSGSRPRAALEGVAAADVPVDLVTASASGVDPDISRRGRAAAGGARGARARGSTRPRCERWCDDHVHRPTFGFLGTGPRQRAAAEPRARPDWRGRDAWPARAPRWRAHGAPARLRRPSPSSSCSPSRAPCLLPFRDDLTVGTVALALLLPVARGDLRRASRWALAGAVLGRWRSTSSSPSRTTRSASRPRRASPRSPSTSAWRRCSRSSSIDCATPSGWPRAAPRDVALLQDADGRDDPQPDLESTLRSALRPRRRGARRCAASACASQARERRRRGRRGRVGGRAGGAPSCSRDRAGDGRPTMLVAARAQGHPRRCRSPRPTSVSASSSPTPATARARPRAEAFLESFAGVVALAAARDRLATRACGGARWRRPTGCAPRCSRASRTTCARR